MKSNSYATLRKMNKPIRFFGLSPLQFLLFFGIGLFIIIIQMFRGSASMMVLSIIGIIIIFMFSFKKLNAEHKKGNPDYLKGMNIKSSTPKKITDRNHFFKMVKK